MNTKPLTEAKSMFEKAEGVEIKDFTMEDGELVLIH
jgi:hypothetical protein